MQHPPPDGVSNAIFAALSEALQARSFGRKSFNAEMQACDCRGNKRNAGQ